MKVKNVFYSTLLIVAFGCGASKHIADSNAPAVTDAELANAQKRFPDATITSITEGKKQYEANCGRCHGLKNPSDFTEQRLNEVVPKMFVKAKIEDLAVQQSIREYVFSKVN